MNIIRRVAAIGTIVTLIGSGGADVTDEAVQPPSTIEQQQFSEEDVRLMSSIIYAEAGNQCIAGQQAVGIIVMNRSESEDFADGISNVIYEDNQFAPVEDGHLDKALLMYDTHKIPPTCIEAALYALSGNKTVQYNNEIIDLSDYYYFSRKLKGTRIKIQDHCFK